MNNYSLSHPYGMSSLWPEINIPFLSLQGIPDHAIPPHRIQKIYRELLIGFDALTSCELKEFYKFKLFLQKLDHQDPPCP